MMGQIFTKKGCYFSIFFGKIENNLIYVEVA
jgi:hypothetical protein